jgi:hypothetical protein
MGLAVIEDKCEVGTEKGTIIVESDRPEGSMAFPELQGADCRRLAIKQAALMGLPDPRINGTVNTFPVDENGEEIIDPRGKTFQAFRAEVPVTRRLV